MGNDMKFSEVRNTLHTYSRSPLAKGQLWPDQTGAVAGHTVSFEKVRAQAIPAIVDIQDRDDNFLVETNGKRAVGGVKGTPYKDVIAFIDRASLKEIPDTNGESFLIVDSENAPYMNIISPTDKPINQYVVSEGYEIRMFGANGEEIPKDYGWSFDSYTGIIHFSPESKPGLPTWKFGAPVVECFAYIGKFMDNVITDLSGVNDTISQVSGFGIAIQPFKFSTQQMTTIGEPYALDGSNDVFQKLTFVVPGFVFELTSLDRDETVLTEMRHLPNGDTQIFLDLPWDIVHQCCIISYSYDSGQDGLGTRLPVIGKYKFLAMTFVTNNGGKIPVKETFDYEQHEQDVIPVISYDYSTEYEPGIVISDFGGDLPDAFVPPPPRPPVPVPPPHPGPMPHPPYTDDININFKP